MSAQLPGPFQPGAPYASFAATTGQPQRARTSVTGPAIMTWIGIGLIVLAFAAAAFGVHAARQAEPTVLGAARSGTLISVDPRTAETISVRPGTTYLVIDFGDESAAIAADDVMLTWEDGRSEPLTEASDERLSGLARTLLTPIGEVRVPHDSFEVTVEVAATAQPHTDDTLAVVTPEQANRLINGLGWAIAAIAVAFAASVSGIGLTIGGGLWWHSRIRARRAMAYQPGAAVGWPG